MKVPFIIYPDVESLLEKVRSFQNDLKKSYTKKIYLYSFRFFISKTNKKGLSRLKRAYRRHF